MVLGSLYNHSKQAKDIIMAITYLQNHPTAPVKITIPCGSPKKTLSQKQNHTMTQQVVIGPSFKRHVVKKENKASVVSVGLQAQLENKEKRVLEGLQGLQGPTGLQGLQGPSGANGKDGEKG